MRGAACQQAMHGSGRVTVQSIYDAGVYLGSKKKNTNLIQLCKTRKMPYKCVIYTA